MKKIVEIVKKHDNIFMIICLITIFSAFAFYRYLEANDELWNFSNIYKMYNGYTIYKDINVIITPLYFVIGKVLFQILGANYMVYRLYRTVIVYTFFGFMIYKLFKKLGTKKIDAILYSIIISIICVFKFVDASYNILAMSFAIMGIYNQISEKLTKKNYVIQGGIIFLVFLSKQNIGIYYLIALIIYQLMQKEKLKNIIIQFITILILSLGLYGYMQIIGNWNDFVNYAFGGIKEFAIQNLAYNIIDIIFIIVEVILSIFIIILTFNEKIPFNGKQRQNIRLLGIVSVAMTAIAYPIFNIAHKFLASINFIILIIYSMDTMMASEILNTKNMIKIKKVIIAFVTVQMLAIGLTYNIKYITTIKNQQYPFSKTDAYYGSIVKEETCKDIEEIVKYIKEENNNGIDIKIVSYYSNLYMNVLKKNNGDFDLPFNGNLGQEGEDRLIRKIRELKNTKVLILTEEDTEYQESKKVTEFIKSNMKHLGTIGRFSIYSSDF